MTTKRKKIDWEAIEDEYRAGSLSIRNIADKHGISDTAIRKKATLHGWQRDLAEKVRSAAQGKIVRKMVRADGSRTDEEIIEQASSEAAAVVLAHRAELAAWR